MTKTEEHKLKTALRRLEKCGGDCHHCEKCRVYTRSTERALYMAVGCDLLPVEMFSYIADTPKGLHAAALETARFELELAVFQDMFSRLGRKYGYLREFRENGIL